MLERAGTRTHNDLLLTFYQRILIALSCSWIAFHCVPKVNERAPFGGSSLGSQHLFGIQLRLDLGMYYPIIEIFP